MFTKALGIWLYGLMCWLLPVERGVELTRNDPTTAETVEERDARYHGIADAIAEVVTSPDVVMPFKGKNGAVNSAGLLLAVTYKESGWRKDVDFGVGKRSRGEGVDSCLAQIRVGVGKTDEGWSHEDLTGDRKKCFTAALRLMARSYASCRDLPPEEKLTAYTSGNCRSDRGKEKSRERVTLSRRLLAHETRPTPPVAVPSLSDGARPSLAAAELARPPPSSRSPNGASPHRSPPLARGTTPPTSSSRREASEAGCRACCSLAPAKSPSGSFEACSRR